MERNNKTANVVSLIDDYFDSTNVTDDEMLIEIVKRVGCVRQIENITGTRGMSIHTIPEDIYIPEAFIGYLEDYKN